MKGSPAREREIRLQHERLGHLNFASLKIMYPDLFKGFDLSFLKSEICELAKSHRVPYPLRNNRCDFPFSLIHTDIWGPSRVTGMSGTRWFISFIDDCTRVTWIYLMREKSDAIGISQKFYKMISVQFDAKVKVIRSNNGGEYFSGSLNMFLMDNGIIHESSCTDTPEQNGVAERKNRHLLEVARSLLFARNVPKIQWANAVT